MQDSVVSIVATKDIVKYKRNPFYNDNFFNDPFFNQFFGNRFEQRAPQEEGEEEKTERVKVGGGSGFVYSSSGLILTNKHVVADEKAEYTVVLYDGTELNAEVLARDAFNDVAVVKVSPKDGEEMPELKALKFGQSSGLQVGQRVVAIGNALAEFENTVTTGIVSAKGRSIVASDGHSAGEKIQNLIQTDAAINPGNSGGALVNLAGEVIGMNTAIAQGAEGIGFAIPVDDLKSVADSVEKYGKIIRPFIGVRYMMLSPEISKKLNLEIEEGALLITDAKEGIPAIVKDSPADKAGLKANDIILEIDSKKLSPDYDLRMAVSEKNVGDEILLKISRDAHEMEIKLKLEEYQEEVE
ncbi:trypsin-like serine protease [Candidatus Peregrinibacteria bacterium]|nr:trypsin-like serine protease [Candidatus Peregrinibacteria bacterium]